MTIQPIYSRESEEAVIGAVLINQEVFKTIDLQPSDFYDITYGEVWQAFQKITMEGGTIDILTVKEKLNGKTDVLNLVANVPSSLHAKHYSEIIREKARRRQLVVLASDMAKSAYNQTGNLEEEIPEYLTRLVNSAWITNGAEHVSVALAELYDEIKERSLDPRDIWGIPTGFTDYDLMTGGHHPGEMTLLSGKPGLGKSIICIQMAVGMSKHSPGVIYEMEMGKTQTVRRSVSNESRIETRRMRNGNVKGEDWNLLAKAIASMETLPIYITDHTGWTTASMRADLARLKAQQGIKWFVVDYLYLLQDQYGNNDYERLAYISKSLKNICKDLDLSGLIIHSMTKAEMNSDNPSLAGMRGSGQIAYDADVAVYLIEDELDQDNVKLYFVKFREDIPDRYVRLRKDIGYPAFKNIENGYTTRTPYKD